MDSTYVFTYKLVEFSEALKRSQKTNREVL